VTSTLASEGDGRWTEYAGGYSDMLSQRGADLPDRPTTAAIASLPRARSETGRVENTRVKMSFKDRHALERLPRDIASLQAEAARLRGILSDANLYTRDNKRFAATTAALAKAEADLVAQESRWLELEMLRETLEG
jgi:ATP-binding cassette subfamily F protein uup